MANLVRNKPSDETDNSLHAVADADRMPRFAPWHGGPCAAMFYIVVRGDAGAEYGARNAIIGMALSVVCYGIVSGIIRPLRDPHRPVGGAVLAQAVPERPARRAGRNLLRHRHLLRGVRERRHRRGGALLIPPLPYWLVALAVVIYSVLLIFGGVRRWLEQVQRRAAALLSAGPAAGRGNGHARIRLQRRLASLRTCWRRWRSGWWDAFVYYMGVWILMMFTFDYAAFRQARGSGVSQPFQFRHAVLHGDLPAQRRGRHLQSARFPAMRRCRKCRWCWPAQAHGIGRPACSSGSRRPASIPPTTTWPPSTCGRPSSRFSGMRWPKGRLGRGGGRGDLR